MKKQYLLGIDLGSSSVKVSMVDVASGRCVASSSYPEREAPIKALQPGWAEQRPDDWWDYLKVALCRTMKDGGIAGEDIAAIGISYQMHGLVCLDKDCRTLRDAIIWCDSRGVPYGERLARDKGETWCMEHLFNLPGNFTASKLAWVQDKEPELYAQIHYIMLPGDWLAMRLGCEAATTACGLSEMMLWDYREHCAVECAKLPPLVSTFGLQGRVSAAAADELGLSAGTPITYRAGDQPNNALSLAVLAPGEVTATAGTSGVVYGAVDNGERRATEGLNTFLHVNHKLGMMHCVNGCGIMNSWMRHNVAPTMSYDDINRLAAQAPAGCDGLTILPFGNGAERVLANQSIGASIHNIDFNRHGQAHLLRAAQEGVAFAMVYGMEKIGGIKVIRAGRANMFLSPLFRETIAAISGATIELYDTDGSIGAARGAGLGVGIYASAKEAFATLQCLLTVEPQASNAINEAYARWKECLSATLQRPRFSE